MNGKVLLCVGLVALSLSAAGAQGGDREEPKNLVGAHLIGKWSRDADLSARLGGSAAKGEVAFREDASVEKKLPEEAAAFLKPRGIFLCGVMTKEGKEYPFVLTQISGSPHVIYIREQAGKPFGDSESFYLSVAVGSAKEKDILFIGGDFDNQAFDAYVRAK